MKKVLTLITVALLLGACGQKQNTSRTAGRSTGGGVTGPNGNVSSTYQLNSSWTLLTGYTQQNVVDLLSVSPGITLGNVATPNCMTLSGQSCAIVFNVAVNPGTQQPSPIVLNTNTSPYQVTGSATLTIAIYDSLTGNGTSAIAVAVPLQSGQLAMQGNSGSAYAVFGDGAGTVIVGVNGQSGSGNVNGQNFSDSVAFNNSSGNISGYPEGLGNFQTSICGIFQCYN